MPRKYIECSCPYGLHRSYCPKSYFRTGPREIKPLPRVEAPKLEYTGRLGYGPEGGTYNYAMGGEPDVRVGMRRRE